MQGRPIAVKSRGVPLVVAVLAFVSIGRPAAAQYRQFGEDYRVEILGGEWFPPPDPVITQDAPGVPGTDINFVLDLGVQSKRFSLWRVTVRPAPRHKVRVEFLPLRYHADGSPRRALSYNGVQFEPGLAVSSRLAWDAWRFGYEYDLFRGLYGYAGVIAELKYNKVTSRLANGRHEEMTVTHVAMPGVGVIARLYLIPEIVVTGEVSGVRLPDRERRAGRYLDYDLSGTLNFSDNVGFQAGTRSMDVRYRVDAAAGAIEVREKYFAAVVRF